MSLTSSDELITNGKREEKKKGKTLICMFPLFHFNHFPRQLELNLRLPSPSRFCMIYYR